MSEPTRTIAVRVDSVEPFTGAVVDDETTIPFEGWLDFLGTLSRRLTSSGAA